MSVGDEICVAVRESKTGFAVSRWCIKVTTQSRDQDQSGSGCRDNSALTLGIIECNWLLSSVRCVLSMDVQIGNVFMKISICKRMIDCFVSQKYAMTSPRWFTTLCYSMVARVYVTLRNLKIKYFLKVELYYTKKKYF